MRRAVPPMFRRCFTPIVCLALLATAAEAGRIHAIESAAPTGLASLDLETGEVGDRRGGPAIDPETGCLHGIGRMAAGIGAAADAAEVLRLADDYRSGPRKVRVVEVPAAPEPASVSIGEPTPAEPTRKEPYALLGIGVIGLTGWALRFRSRTSWLRGTP